MGYQGSPFTFQCRIGKRQLKLGGRRDFYNLRLELGCTIHSDVSSVTFHRQAQRRRQALTRGSPGDLKPITIISNGG